MRRMKSLTAIAVIGAMVSGMGALPAAATYDPCDVNRDGTVSIQDSIYVNRYLMGYFYLSDPSVLDASGNDVIDAADSACVLAALTDSDFENPFVPLDAGTQTASVNVTGVTKSRDYVVYNFDSDTETGNYTLTLPEGEGASSRTIQGVIGEDDREPYVNSGIVRIGYSWGVGTGFVVGDHTIATAAQCVYRKESEYDYFSTFTSISFYNEDGNFARSIYGKETHVPSEYIECAYASRHNYDYALITVSEDLSDYEHFDLGIVLNEALLTDQFEVHAAGCPSKIEDENGNVVTAANRMYICTGELVETSDYLIHFDADVTGGQSGGPVFVTSEYAIGSGEPVSMKTVIGINSHVHINEPLKNGATRMTPELFAFYRNNPYNTYEE